MAVEAILGQHSKEHNGLTVNTEAWENLRGVLNGTLHCQVPWSSTSSPKTILEWPSSEHSLSHNSLYLWEKTPALKIPVRAVKSLGGKCSEWLWFAIQSLDTDPNSLAAASGWLPSPVEHGLQKWRRSSTDSFYPSWEEPATALSFKTKLELVKDSLFDFYFSRSPPKNQPSKIKG